MSFLAWIILGLIAGFIGSKLVNRRGEGVVLDILLGGGMYASFLIIPQFAQLPASTGFGFGASVVTAGLYLLPAALGMSLLGSGSRFVCPADALRMLRPG